MSNVERAVDKFARDLGVSDKRRACSSYGPYGLLGPATSKVTSPDNLAQFHLLGRAEIWDCLRNPISTSEVRWRVIDVGAIKTKVPVVTKKPGPPIKALRGSEPFDVRISLRLKVADQRRVECLREVAAPKTAPLKDAHRKVESYFSEVSSAVCKLVSTAMEKLAVAPKDLDAARFLVRDSKLFAELHLKI
jgi:hypothetical protein